jgi:hypothetical protein
MRIRILSAAEKPVIASLLPAIGRRDLSRLYAKSNAQKKLLRQGVQLFFIHQLKIIVVRQSV